MNWINLVEFEVPSGIPHSQWDHVIAAAHQVPGREFRLRFDGLEADKLTVISLQLSSASYPFGAGGYYEDGFSMFHNGENGLIYPDASPKVGVKDTSYHLPLPGGEGFQLTPDLGEFSGANWTKLGARGEARFRGGQYVSGQLLRARCSVRASKGEWAFGSPNHRLVHLNTEGHWAGQGAITGIRVTARTRGASAANLIYGRLALDVLA